MKQTRGSIQRAAMSFSCHSVLVQSAYFLHRIDAERFTKWLTRNKIDYVLRDSGQDWEVEWS